MSLASIPISLLSMVIMYSVGMKRMGPYYQSAQKMNNTIIEYINGMEVVKVFNKDADSYERFRKMYQIIGTILWRGTRRRGRGWQFTAVCFHAPLF